MLQKQRALKCVLAITLITGVLLFAMPVMAQTNGGMVDKIVAVVNEDIVTSHELNKRLKQVLTSIENAPLSPEEKVQARQQVQGDMLQEMIREKLIEQEIKRYNISVSDAEVNDAIDNIKSNNNFTDEALREALALQGYDYNDYREEIRRQILSSKLMNRQIRSRVVVTEADVQKYYNENSGDFLSTREYKVWNLFVRWSEFGDGREQQMAGATIEKLYTRLQNGEDFKVLAQGAGQTYGGGELGTFRLNEIAPDFRPIIAELNANQHSKILPGNGVAQIFYVEEVIVAGDQSLEQVRPEIEEVLYRQGMEKKFDTWMQELRDQSHIEILQN